MKSSKTMSFIIIIYCIVSLILRLVGIRIPLISVLFGVVMAVHCFREYTAIHTKAWLYFGILFTILATVSATLLIVSLIL